MRLIEKYVFLFYTVKDKIDHLQKILINTRPLQDNFQKKEMLTCKGPLLTLRKTGQIYAEIVLAAKAATSSKTHQ